MAPSSMTFAQPIRRHLASAFAFGVALASWGVAPEAQALSCESAVYERLDLQLSTVSRDGVLLDRDDPGAEAASWAQAIESTDGAGLRMVDAEWNSVWLNQDLELEPSSEVADHIANNDDRRTRSFLCGGLPFLTAQPGIYLQDDDAFVSDEIDWPEDATVTLDNARNTVAVDFVNDEGAYTVTYEVVDFYFPGYSNSGCSVNEGNAGGPAAWGLGLLMLVGWRRRSARSQAQA